MSDDEDLFGSSDEDDTDDLFAEANTKKPVAKKKRLQKKSAVSKKRKLPDADNDEEEEEEDDDDGKGLFDESDDDEPKRPLSKKEKLDALQAKKRLESGSTRDGHHAQKRSANEGNTRMDGYESEDSYNSAQFVRTKEDNDFIDMDDDDSDAINELHSEQHFDDERPHSEEEESKLKSRKRATSSSGRRSGPDTISDDEANDNPIMAVVNKMKRKKRAQKKPNELEDEAKEFVSMMEDAADDDDEALKGKRPATKKLSMLQHVVDTLTRRDMMRPVLDANVLVACKRWIQPLRNGKLGNVTVRQRLIGAIANMNGENGISSHDLRQSGIGHTIMILYKHKSETPSMKRDLKRLIEQWSRPIFQKSGNMKDLEHVHASRRNAGLPQQVHQKHAIQPKSSGTRDAKDLQTMIVSGNKGKGKESLNRVRVPFSKGFQFTVRPQGKTGNVADKRMIRPGAQKDNRGNLSKRMVEKGRAVAKNQRSANLSVEGRPVK